MTAHDTRRLCEGKTTKGRACRQQALPGSHFCATHDPDRPVSPRWAEAARLENSGELEQLRRKILEDR